MYFKELVHTIVEVQVQNQQDGDLVKSCNSSLKTALLWIFFSPGGSQTVLFRPLTDWMIFLFLN